MKAGKVKIWQMSTILHKIYKDPGLTRVELGKQLHVDKSMITRILSHLIESGWIVEAESKPKSVPLRINKNRLLVAGIDLKPERQNVCICNAAGEIIANHSWNRALNDIDSFLNDTIPEYLLSSGLQIGAAGLAIPGVFERQRNSIVCSHPLSIKKKRKLPDRIEKCDCPLFTDNDARCCGWGIVAFEKEKSDFMLLMISLDEHETPNDEYKRVGIGTALFFNQLAHEGCHSRAGEFRSMYRRDLSEAGQSEISHAFRQKMKTKKTIFNAFVSEMAHHCAFIVNYLDLEKLYIGGSIENFRSEIESVFESTVGKNRLYRQLPGAKVCFAGLGELSAARGAAGLAYERLFSEPAVEQPSSFYLDISKKKNRQ